MYAVTLPTDSKCAIMSASASLLSWITKRRQCSLMYFTTAFACADEATLSLHYIDDVEAPRLLGEDAAQLVLVVEADGLGVEAADPPAVLGL